MGIRLHKVIGYGLTDVVTKDGTVLDDPRIDADSPFVGGVRPDGHLSYLDWLKSTPHDEDDFGLLFEIQALESGQDYGPEQYAVTWAPEYGMENVLVVRPLTERTWDRSDNPIDYAEHNVTGLEPDNRVHVLRGGLYPYDGLWMDSRTGEQIMGPDRPLHTWNTVRRAEDSGWEDRPRILDHLAAQMGFTDHAEAERCVVPLVPDSVRRLCEWGGLFTGPDVWLQLRPLLYVYWG